MNKYPGNGAGEPNGPNAAGHTIVQAESPEAASRLARQSPLLRHGREINVFELLPT